MMVDTIPFYTPGITGLMLPTTSLGDMRAISFELFLDERESPKRAVLGFRRRGESEHFCGCSLTKTSLPTLRAIAANALDKVVLRLLTPDRERSGFAALFCRNGSEIIVSLLEDETFVPLRAVVLRDANLQVFSYVVGGAQ